MRCLNCGSVDIVRMKVYCCCKDCLSFDVVEKLPLFLVPVFEDFDCLDVVDRKVFWKNSVVPLLKDLEE